MKANILAHGLLTIMGSCEVDPVTSLLAIARVHDISTSDSEAIGWFLYDFASVIIVAVPEWNVNECKQGRSNNPLHGAVHPKDCAKLLWRLLRK